ncbi:nose resistant to fluoxetine protein 6 [Diachasma alloeum]|uniref:nose resistant to fluoxetine protein 6 n=1 Tax=Diachasma alloeum TaxID=454923 RepID=UPI00073819E8|nr:nose resistant to fluoxetine protein 6 [Diachasma alloeum]
MSVLTLIQRSTLILILLIIHASSVISSFRDDNAEINVQSHLVHQLNSFRVNQSLLVSDVIRKLQPESVIALQAKRDSDQSNPRAVYNDTECDIHFTAFVSALSKSELWALQMLDSSSKIPSGILIGNSKDLGVYDECVSVNVQKEIGLIRGRHCMYSISFTVSNSTTPLSTTLSICLPSTCNAQHVNDILQTAIDMVSDRLPFDLGIGNVQCSAVDPPPFEVGEIITIVILSIILCFFIGCTVCDIIIRITSRKKSGGIVKEICNFSFYTNVKRIFDTTVPRGNIPAIQGIRFFSLCWVVLGHEHLYPNTTTAINMKNAISWVGSWDAIHILIAPFAVDTFFVLSGFLSSYLFIKEIAKGRRFNPVMYYIHRYIRLTPAFAAMIALSIFLLPRMGSGALWDSTMMMNKEMCSNSWWPMILYVHNHVGKNSTACLGHTWYLAVDMQLFWISPLILYPLAKTPKIGLGILAAFIIASVIIPAIIIGKNKYSAALISSGMKMTNLMDTFGSFYITAYARAGPWLLGIYLGYRLSGKRDHPGTNFIALGWILSALAFAFSFFSYRIFQNVDYEWNAPWEIFYAGFGRHIWAFGICWLIYASVKGYGGPIADFLSLPIFIPFGRMSYCIYLVHMVIQLMRVAAARVPSYFTELGIIYSFFGEFIVSIIAGLALSLVFESPFLVLEKMIFGGNRRVKKQESPKNVEDTEASLGIDNKAYNSNESVTYIEKERDEHGQPQISSKL